MKKLTIEHLAAYLPYGLKIHPTVTDGEFKVLDEDNIGEYLFMPLGLPILIPLSDLTKEIEHNGERFVPFEKILKSENSRGVWEDWIEHFYDLKPKYNEMNILSAPYDFIKILLEWHFDIHNLIENNLAVNINDIK